MRSNELCGGVDIVVEEDGDKTDDGRYYYFGDIYKVYMCDICNGFFDAYVQY